MLKKMLLFSAFSLLPFGLSADYVKAERYYQEKNYSAAFQEFLTDANKGSYISQYKVGYLYLYGLGVNKDIKKALEYLTAAAQKNANAQTLLGYLYSKGEVVPMDKKKAIEFYEMAVKQQDESAKLNLGLAYYEGDGVTKNSKKAIELLSQVPIDSTRNYVGHYLGNIYMNSSEDNKEQKAKDYYKKSAKENYIPSFYALGELLEKDGDMEKALAYYKYAASQKNAQAQYKLGSMYASGNGVKKDLVTGYAWLTLAAEQRHDAANKSLQKLSKELTITQTTAAHKEINRIQQEIIGKIESPILTENSVKPGDDNTKPRTHVRPRNR